MRFILAVALVVIASTVTQIEVPPQKNRVEAQEQSEESEPPDAEKKQKSTGVKKKKELSNEPKKDTKTKDNSKPKRAKSKDTDVTWRDNPNNCDMETQWVWEDFSCHDKPVQKAVDTVEKVSGGREDWLRAAGIPKSEWGAVKYIINHENGLWCPTRWNGQRGCPDKYTSYNPTGGSSAYGLCQALPGTKMASAGSDWRTNPVTQLKWCDSYAKSRYGSWSAAYRWWTSGSCNTEYGCGWW